MTLEQILVDGYDAVTKALGGEPEALVVLLCNAPTMTGGLIDKGVEIPIEGPFIGCGYVGLTPQ